MNKTRRGGFSLTEIVIVILIIGMLALVGVGVGSKQISGTKKTTMENNLRIVGSEVEKACVDLGFLDGIDDADYVRNYFNEWDSKYLTCHLDVANMRIIPKGDVFGSDYAGAIIQTTNYKDPWGMELYVFYMIPQSGGNYRIVIASAGHNSQFSDDAASGYLNDEYDDDVLLVMIPRT